MAELLPRAFDTTRLPACTGGATVSCGLRCVRDLGSWRGRDEMRFDVGSHCREQRRPAIGAAEPDRHEVGPDEHVLDVVERREQLRYSRIVDGADGFVPPT